MEVPNLKSSQLFLSAVLSRLFKHWDEEADGSARRLTNLSLFGWWLMFWLWTTKKELLTNKHLKLKKTGWWFEASFVFHTFWDDVLEKHWFRCAFWYNSGGLVFHNGTILGVDLENVNQIWSSLLKLAQGLFWLIWMCWTWRLLVLQVSREALQSHIRKLMKADLRAGSTQSAAISFCFGLQFDPKNCMFCWFSGVFSLENIDHMYSQLLMLKNLIFQAMKKCWSAETTVSNAVSGGADRSSDRQLEHQGPVTSLEQTFSIWWYLKFKASKFISMNRPKIWGVPRGFLYRLRLWESIGRPKLGREKVSIFAMD